MSDSDTENDSGTDEDVIDKEAEPKVCLRHKKTILSEIPFFLENLAGLLFQFSLFCIAWGSCFRGSEILVETFPITVWLLKRYEGWFFLNHSELNFLKEW